MASMVKILAGVNLLFALASAWSMAFLIFQAVINFAIVAAGMMRRKPESISTSSSSSGINYDVFLSFRGPDTRIGFTDHLYIKLIDAGINVFRDEEDLCAGEEINPSLKEAIKGSTISIAILSRNYASSKSCLMELVQMWECRESNGQTIIPIFYDISPSDVKHQTGDFGRSFDQHVLRRVDSNTIQTWKGILQRIGELNGYDRKNINGGHEAQLVKEVLTRVRQVLKKDDQVVPDNLVGIDLHVHEMMTKLGVVYSNEQAIKVCGGDVRVVGIWGIRGVGKTTLARVVFNKMRGLFQECSFLEDTNSEGVVSSQERLIASLKRGKREAIKHYGDGITKMENLFSKTKVLIVLDDVREVEVIKGLVGKLTWFGPGSRIIVTTYKKDVLYGFDHGEVKEYEVGQMRHHYALQLFRKHAFPWNAPQDVSQYDSLSIDIVKAIGGLPKAIEIHASYLSQERDNIEAWTNTLDSLKRHPPEGVKTLFDIGYKSLDHHRKKIFLDIACFFVGNDEKVPTYMWKACDCYPPTGINPLRNLHWLENGENNELRMDNMIRDFGRDIVKSKLVHKRCRFWNNSDALSILKNRTGTKRVEGIGLTVEKGNTDSFECEQFWKMSNLRYLRLDRAKIQGDAAKLPPNLRWLEWRECDSIHELSKMHLEELVILDLSWSVPRDSSIWGQIMKKAEKLKVLNLRGCVLSDAALNFSAPINLEILILEGCTLLTEIGTFISRLEKLKSLNLRNCERVMKLPEGQHCMKSLTELLIDGTGIEKIQIQTGSLENLEVLSACACKKLDDISPIDRLENLTSLALAGADINWDPETFEFPRTLKRLSLKECRRLVKLPSSIGNVKVLEVMDLSDTVIKDLPSSVEKLTQLRTLKMAGTPLNNFPRHIVKLANLEEIDFSGCSLEGKVCHDISKLSSLRILRLSSSDVAGLPPSICHLPCLQTLDILDCNQLHTLPKLPSSLLSLRWKSKKMTIPDLSYLTSLKELLLTDGEQPKAGGLMMLLNLMTPNIGWITRLPSLETLQLSLSKFTSLPRNFSALAHFRELSLSYMQKLDLTQLPSTSRLSTLRLKHCKIRKPKFSSLQHLSELELEDCDLAKIDRLEDLKLLEVLTISHCCNLTNLNGLERIGRLRKVEVIFSPLVVLPRLSECVEVARCD